MQIMNKGKYVFSQIMTYFPRRIFEDSVKKYKGDFHAKNLNSYSHCLHLMFGQLAGCKSLKDITLVLRSVNKSAYHLGIPVVIDSSSLSKANESRDYESSKNLVCSSSARSVRCTSRKTFLMYIFPDGRSLQLTLQQSFAASSWLNGL